jgi:hypothetical protein
MDNRLCRRPASVGAAVGGYFWGLDGMKVYIVTELIESAWGDEECAEILGVYATKEAAQNSMAPDRLVEVSIEEHEVE